VINGSLKRRSSVPVALLLIVALLASGWVRSKCLAQRRALDEERGRAATAQANLGKLNSFALGLLLGGLRGPLVMALWTSSENQKSEKNLDDFDTKVDLIRLLQPEFDSVHLFQIWNKAYNISVQMANLPNKYATILDALDYGFSVDREQPGNINIISAIGGLYFDKFGNSAEKFYFSPRLMDETLPAEDRYRVYFPAAKRQTVLREARMAGASPASLLPREVANMPDTLTMTIRKSAGEALKARLSDPSVELMLRPAQKVVRGQNAGRRIEHETLLDENFRLLPQFYEPRNGSPKFTEEDGTPLPYLKQFEPYPLGVSPIALGYNYLERARWLQKYREARHAQTSDRIVSSRPAMALKKWSEEDWYAGLRSEIILLGREVPREEEQLQMVSVDLPLSPGLPASPLLDQTIWRLENSARIADAAVAAYQSHLQDYPGDFTTYASHVESSVAQGHLVRGDGFYLKAMRANGPERTDLIKQAINHYQQSANFFTRHIFRFYMSDEDVPRVLPRDFRHLTRVDVDDPKRFRDEELPVALFKLRSKYLSATMDQQLEHAEEFREFDAMIRRATLRIQSLRAAL
jgi:hypothetical protein